VVVGVVEVSALPLTPSSPSLSFPCLLPDAELLEMIERADSDHDGEINFEEFYAIMTKKTLGP